MEDNILYDTAQTLSDTDLQTIYGNNLGASSSTSNNSSTLLNCNKCNQGPFKGPIGLKIHQTKQKCKEATQTQHDNVEFDSHYYDLHHGSRSTSSSSQNSHSLTLNTSPTNNNRSQQTPSHTLFSTHTTPRSLPNIPKETQPLDQTKTPSSDPNHGNNSQHQEQGPISVPSPHNAEPLHTPRHDDKHIIQQLETHISELTNTLKQKEQECLLLHNNLQQRNQDFLTLQQTLEHWELKEVENKQVIDSMKNQLQKTNDTITELQTNLDHITGNETKRVMEKFQNEIKKLKDFNHSLQNEIKNGKDSISLLQNELKTEKESLTKCNQTLTRTEQLHADAEGDYLRSATEVVELNSLVNTLNEKIRILTTDLDKLKDHNNSLNIQYNTAQHLLNSRESENATLSSQTKKLTNEIKSYRDINNTSLKLLNKLQQENKLTKHRKTTQNTVNAPPTIQIPPHNQPPTTLQAPNFPPSPIQPLLPPGSFTVQNPETTNFDVDIDDDFDSFDNLHHTANMLRSHGPPNSTQHSDTHRSNNNHRSQNHSSHGMDVYAGIQLATLANNTNIKTLNPDELYRSNIHGPLSLSRWINSIEVATPDSRMRAQLAVQKLDTSILERLRQDGGDIHTIPWSTLISKLYNYLTPSSFENALKNLYDMQYDGGEHPSTYYSMLCGLRRTLTAQYPHLQNRIPSLKKMVSNCMLPNVTRTYRNFLANYINTQDNTLDEFLSRFAKIYDDEPHSTLFYRNGNDFANVNHMGQFPSSTHLPYYPHNTLTPPFPVHGGNHPHTYNPSEHYALQQTAHYTPPLSTDHRFRTQQTLPHNHNTRQQQQPPTRTLTHTYHNTQPHTQQHTLPQHTHDVHRIQTRPWDSWNNWDCSCGQHNSRQRGTCAKCNFPCPQQPEDCRLCECGRRVFIHAKTCFYCKKESNTLNQQNNRTTS